MVDLSFYSSLVLCPLVRFLLGFRLVIHCSNKYLLRFLPQARHCSRGLASISEQNKDLCFLKLNTNEGNPTINYKSNKEISKLLKVAVLGVELKKKKEKSKNN